MDTEQAIRTRRTIKAFEPQAVDRATVGELLELARWAPNHNLTNPWRFRVIGPEALRRLKSAAGELAVREAPPGCDEAEVAAVAAAKLARAPTLIACSVLRSDDPVREEEDSHAAACAAYIVLLAAHARGLAGYWRTPGVLRTEAGRAGLGLGTDERFVGLLYLGRPRQAAAPPAREGPERYVTYLD